ncbi:MAG: GDP-mannose 4,6-dehydratase [bacterium]|nr:GDP-mannose 4,6-dehydratase [bacterium]
MENASSSMEGLVKNMGSSFWLKKKVLITGYEGFLGSNLTQNLLNQGAKIWGLDIKTRRKETILSKKELNKIKIIKGSVENLSLVSKIIKENKIEIVFHLAASALVGNCLKNPVEAFSTNIEGTWNILESCRNNKHIKAIIIASSDKAYGSQKKLPYLENTPLAGEHPYDVSKSCADLIAYAYYHTYDMPVAVTRCGNIYGPGDFNFSRIIPETVKCALSGNKLMIRSDGKFVRDYVYVGDIVNGYIMLAEQLEKKDLRGEAFNFSDENPINVIELVKNIYKQVGAKTNYIILNKAKYEIKNQYLASAKARKILGWKPEYTLKDGIERTIDWHKNNYGYSKKCPL